LAVFVICSLVSFRIPMQSGEESVISDEERSLPLVEMTEGEKVEMTEGEMVEMTEGEKVEMTEWEMVEMTEWEMVEMTEGKWSR
jgi:hypothetical protein